MEDKKELFIVDGHALVFRAYYAMIRNPLINSKGMNTSALYGFANYLIRIIQQYKCSHLVVTFDPPKPSFRKDIYEEYKANRASMPEDLREQMPFMFELVDKLNIPYYMENGFEADDLIADLTTKAEKEGFTVKIVSKDKDLMQLVTSNVSLLAPETGGKFTEYNATKVEEKMGVPPERVLDLLSLMGDSADNIPGVPGVGPKTAIKIIQKAGSVDALLEDPSLLENAKLTKKIEENKDNLIISKKLASLCFDTGVEFKLDELKLREVKAKECVTFFKEMEFTSLLNNSLFDITEDIKFTYSVPASIDEVKELAETILAKEFLSIDTETTSVDAIDAELVGISLALDSKHGWYIPVGHSEGNNLSRDEILATLKPVLESSRVKKIGQNLKYDYKVFRKYDVTMKNIYFDTMIAAYVIDPSFRQYNMDALSMKYLNYSPISIETLIGKGKKQISFADVPIETAAEYASEDVIIPLQLMELFEKELTDKKVDTLFHTIEMPLVPVLGEMELMGVTVDKSLLNEMEIQYQGEIDTLSKDIFDLAGEEFNLNSPKQIGTIFFEKLEMPVIKKTKTGYSTNVDVLTELAKEYPIAEKLLHHREVQKLLSTYIKALPTQIKEKSGRVHTSFNQTVAATGRLSSTDPNLQNIPIRTEMGRKIREAFIPAEGKILVAADYSQIELRILAHVSHDDLLIRAFVENRDIHRETAAAIYKITPELVTDEMRRNAKTINFGLMYGMGARNLSGQLGISYKEAKKFIEIYFEQFPTILKFMTDSKEKAHDEGYTETLLGRRRYLPDILSSNRMVKEAAERVAVNTPVQGTAADIIKIAMINIHKELPQVFPSAKMLLQVHDELIFEVDEKDLESFRSWIETMMSSAYSLEVPLLVEAGSGVNWRIAH